MAEVGKLTAKLEVDSRGFSRGMKRAKGDLTGLEQQTGRTARGMSTFGKVAIATGGILAAGALARGVGAAVKRAETMSTAYGITEQVIKATGEAANVTGEHVKDMSREMALATGIDKEMVTNAANILLTFKEIKNVAGENNDIFDRAAKSVADVAVVMKTGLTDGAKQLGRALQDPIRGMTALTRGGITFTDAQKEQVKAMVETGDVLGAQKLILEEIEGQVSGTAEASANATDKIKRSWEEVVETIGTKALPVLEDAADLAVRLTNRIGDVGKALQIWDTRIGNVAHTLTLGLVGGTTAAAKALERFNQTENHAIALLEDGRAGAQVFGEWLKHLADNGVITKDSLNRMGESLGFTTEELRRSVEVARNNADALGLNSFQVDVLGQALYDLKGPIEDTDGALWDYAEAARGATENTDELAEAADRVTSATDRMRTAFSGNIFGDFFKRRQFEIDLLRAGGVGSGQTSYQSGGVVPGPLGAPRLATVHGGEEVLRSDQRGGVVINLNGNLTTSGNVQEEATLALLMAGVSQQAEFADISDLRG